MTKNQFLAVAPKTRAEFVRKYNSDRVFRNYAKVYGITVVGENVLLPNGTVADRHVK